MIVSFAALSPVNAKASAETEKNRIIAVNMRNLDFVFMILLFDFYKFTKKFHL